MARKNAVPTSTAYRWANERDVRRNVEDWRRRSLDRALGQMARSSIRAVNTISRLGEAAESESVQLRAARAILSDLMAVSHHANLESRMGQIEEALDARDGGAKGKP